MASRAGPAPSTIQNAHRSILRASRLPLAPSPSPDPLRPAWRTLGAFLPYA
jgi:hypothetical protein